MKKSFKTIYTSFLLVLFCSFQLCENNLFSQSISADEAVRLALSNNYQMLIQQKQTEIAQKNNKWSEAGLFPTVELTATFGSSIVDNTNNPLTFTPGLVANRQTAPTMAANWNIFSGFSVLINKQRLELLEQQTKGNGLLILENTIQDVLLAYYDALLQKERLNAFRETLNFSKKQVKLEESKSSYGQSGKLSLFQFQNQFYRDSLNVIQQEMMYANAMRNLLLIINEDSEKIENSIFPSLTDSLQIQMEAFDKNELINHILESNQSLKNQVINIALQEKSTQLQKAFLYPTIGAQFGASPNFGRFRLLGDDIVAPPGFPDISEGLRTQQVTYFANINFRYSLFNNWKDKRAVEVAKIQEEIAKYNYEDTKKQVISNATQLYDLFELRNRLLNVANQNVKYAELAYEVAQERFRFGSINSVELGQLQTNYINAKLDLLNTQFQRIESYLQLMVLTGKFQLDYSE